MRLTINDAQQRELVDAVRQEAARIGMAPETMLTIMAYETAGTLDPWQAGPTTQWGQHRGLIQMGGPQRQQYGYKKDNSIRDNVKAAADYFVDRGWKPGMGELNAYSIVNAGSPGLFNRTDANNGGAPGTVRDKVQGRDWAAYSKGIQDFLARHPADTGLMDFAGRTELNADVEGLFGPGAQAAPSILDGFNIVATNNMTGLPTPEAKPMQRVGIPQEKPASLRVDTMQPNQAMARDVAQLNADIGNPELYRQEVQRASLPDLPARPRGIGATPATAYEPGRSIFDGIADMGRANEVVRDTGRTAIGSGDYGPGPVGMGDYAGMSVPEVAPTVTGRGEGYTGYNPAATGSATAQIGQTSRGNTGPSGNPRDAFGSTEIGSPEVDMTAPSQSVFDPQSFGMIDMPTTTAGLLGAIGAPQSVISPQQAPQQAPQAAPPAQMPPMSAPRTIAAMPEVMGHRQGEIRTTPGAVPEVAQAVNRYGLNPDPGPGWSYGFSPYGSGISKVHDNAPERVKAAGTGPGLFGAFKDDFGIDLTPSAGVMTAPIAMGLDAAGGGGLFSLANALGASKAGLDRLDVVDRATRDRVDGVQKEGGGVLGGLFSDPVGAVSRQARNEIGTLGGLFGWGGGSEPATSSQASSGGGIFGGIGGFLNDIFGGGNVSAPSSSIGASRGSTGAASARGF